ncbi:hypothetical protein [Candidatus Spongiihabitans sp.]|uniref:hypothetical protein n=1 Tax=Candidatus Spongiihabitans sp. TaxID=3101308 RepID=UPI003C6F7C3B
MKNNVLKLVLIFALLPASAFAEQLISKSVFVQLADPISHQFKKNRFAYFPAGTKLIKGELTADYRGSTRVLVYAENGIEAYIKEGMYWNKDQIHSFIKEGGNKWVFITRPKDIVKKISDKVKLVIGFSRGETYPLIEEDEDSFTIKVGKNKLPELGEDVNYKVSIPRINSKLVDLSKSLVLRDAGIFKLSIVDGISGIKKPCNTKTAIASKYGGKISGEVGFSLKKFWLELTAKGEVSAETETSKLEEFDKNENVSREYYTRSFNTGIYKLTRYKSCGAKQEYKYIYTNKDIDEIIIHREWAEKLDKDSRTGQVLVTCPQQYFDYFDELSEWNSDPEEIPFIISKTAKFKSLTTKECVKS